VCLAIVALCVTPCPSQAEPGSGLIPSPRGNTSQDEASQATAGYDEGFFVTSADGRFRFSLEGLLQVRARAFDEDGDDRHAGTELERMRFELDGVIDRTWRFHVEPKLTESALELEEAWIGVDLAKEGPLLLVGRMKEPFSLEEMIPRKHLDFPTFSILNQLVPAEDHGLTLLGGSRDARVEWGAAVYDGEGSEALNSDQDVAGRLVLRPWAGREGSRWRRLQFGCAATVGRTDQEVAGDELVTEAKAPFLAFEPGSAIDGERTRLGLEAAWLTGPFAFSAEAMHVEQRMDGAAGSLDATFDGWYAAASWVLTGEEKTFKGVRPASSLARGASGDWTGGGAWQIAARVSNLDLDEGLLGAGIVAAGSFPEDVTTVDVGLNWYATYHARVKLHLVRTEYGEEILVDGDARSGETALVAQFQLHF
jgi:phosphate-selective porin OprO/OprP